MYKLYMITKDLHSRLARSSPDLESLKDLSIRIAEQKSLDSYAITPADRIMGRRPRVVHFVTQYHHEGDEEWVEITENVAGEDIVEKLRIHREENEPAIAES